MKINRSNPLKRVERNINRANIQSKAEYTRHGISSSFVLLSAAKKNDALQDSVNPG